MTNLTIKQFNHICSIMVDNTLDILDKNIEMVKVLGYTEDEINEMDIDHLKALLAEFNADYPNIAIEESFELDGHVFTLQGNPYDFRFNVKQMKGITDAIKKHSVQYIHYMMAVLYDSPDTDVESRAELFNEKLRLYYAIPFINKLKEKYGLV